MQIEWDISPKFQTRLRELLHYDLMTGHFTWKQSRKGVKLGSIAGTFRSDGYIQIGVNQKTCFAHRLTFYYMLGSCPEAVDHINGRRTNNRWINLRPATRKINMKNMVRSVRNTSGTTGV